MELTYGLIWNKRLVIKAVNLCDIVEIRMLNNQSPKCVVHPIVKVCNRNLHTPVLLVIHFYMPVNPYRAHVVCALQERGIVFLWSVNSHHAQKFWVASAIPSLIMWFRCLHIFAQLHKLYLSNNEKRVTYLTQLSLLWQPQEQVGQGTIVSL